ERKPSHYICRFVQIYDGVEDIPETEVMDRYVAKLEEMIRRKPELWLWSHKRWKVKPPKDAVIN
ncbi:MAG: lauroyl acyltransferase, partial [Tidjanibacter sp.]|nr:lauroyl acyltransferase [Tidjanibacter sp.]